VNAIPEPKSLSSWVERAGAAVKQSQGLLTSNPQLAKQRIHLAAGKNTLASVVAALGG
jgi:hypothetical protein